MPIHLANSAKLNANVKVLPIVQHGRPHWKYSELFFEKKAFIPALQQILDPNHTKRWDVQQIWPEHSDVIFLD